MMIYDVTGCKAQIIKPGQTLIAYTWTHFPFAVCNASLYEKTREPVGTIIEGGKIVHNAGNGYGVGTVGGKLGFGNPWAEKWDDYLTGYNSPVQGGKHVAPGFKDTYVFDCKLERIGIGKRGGKTYIVTADNVTLKQFAQDAIKQGFEILVNLDGGGSRHLYYNGRTVYASGRVPYNAIVFEGEAPKDVCPFEAPLVTLRIGAKGEPVKWLQWKLNRAGAKLTVDGAFGVLTWSAVRKFQASHLDEDGEPLEVDGIVGPATKKALEGMT